MSKLQTKISGIPYEYGDGMFSYKEYKRICKKSTRRAYKKYFKKKYNKLVDKIYESHEM